MENMPPPAAPPGSRGRLPANAGTVLGRVPTHAASSKDLTPLERQVLEAGGWKDGDPIPDLTDTAMGKRVTAEAQQIGLAAANTEGLTPVPPNTPPIEVPPIRDISELSPGERQEVYKSMAELAEVKAKLAAASAPPPQATVPEDINMGIPGMAQAATTAAQAVAGAPPPVPIFNDLAERKAAAAARQPATETVSEETDGEVICPRCGLDLNNPTPKPAHQDVLVYVQTVLGGHRFVKQLSLFGGRAVVVFRGLTIREEDAIKAQLADDVERKLLPTAAAVRLRRMEYRMALSIARFTRQGQQPIDIPEATSYAWEASATYHSVVDAMRQDINDKIFVTDTVRQAVAHCWSQFWHILKHLEVKANDPDFYKAIETRG